MTYPMLDQNGDRIEFNEYGYAELTIDGLQHFITLLERNKNFKGCLYRGQTFSDWKLEPSFQRPFGKDREIFDEKYVNILNEHLTHFKLSMRGRINDADFNMSDDGEVWAIGQHYGLRTPLLDFTASPAVALFFAFMDERNITFSYTDIAKGKDINKELMRLHLSRSLFVVDANMLKNDKLYYSICGKKLLQLIKTDTFSKALGKNVIRALEDDPEIVRILIDDKTGTRVSNQDDAISAAKRHADRFAPSIVCPVSGLNKRLVNQRGVFLHWEADMDLQQLIRYNVKNEYMSTDDMRILHVKIEDKRREEILRFLYEMNLSHHSLFPDIEGATLHQNWKMDEMIREKYSDTKPINFDNLRIGSSYTSHKGVQKHSKEDKKLVVRSTNHTKKQAAKAEAKPKRKSQ